MVRRSPCLVLALCLQLGCSSPEPPAPPPAPAAPSAPPPAPPAAPPTPGPGAAPIGLQGLSPEPSKSASASNRSGVAALKRGKVAEARDAFERAVREAGEWDTARYNLACAMARGGQIEEAVGVIEALLERDLPEIGARLGRDPDLESLRRGAVAERLARRRSALEARWLDAARRGQPALLARGGEILRAGVWVHDLRRFLPLGRAMPHTIAAEADPVAGRVVTITAHGGDSVDTGGFAEVRVHAQGLLGKDQPLESRITDVVAVEAYPTPAGARFRWLYEPMGLLRNMWWEDLGPSGSRERDRSWHRPPGVHFFPPGEQAPGVPEPADLRVERETPFGSALRVVRASGQVFDLSPGHGPCGEVVASPDGTAAFVATQRTQGSGTAHVVDRLDLSRGTVTLVDRGPGEGIVRFGAGGHVYLQMADRVVRLPAPDAPASSGEPLGQGVRIALPHHCGS